MVRTLTLIALILTLLTIALGAYVRSWDTEPGCSQWPGCFGRSLTRPDGNLQPRFADDRPVDMAQVRLDIRTHRYFAGAVGVTVLILAALVWTLPENRMRATFWVMAALCMVVMQTALGLWTLEHQLLPLSVTAHLLLGYAILVVIFLSHLAASPDDGGRRLVPAGMPIRWLARICLIILISQLMLGGWTSTHQAGLSCPDFPTCLGRAWPDADYARAFGLSQGDWLEGDNGRLPEAARAAIHWVHRVGGILLYVVVTVLALVITGSNRCQSLRPAGIVMSMLVLTGTGTGIAAVMMRLPTLMVVAHTVLAGLLTLNVIYVNLRLRGRF
ncbi:COX15/CtaA family protein [Methylolobus aquaticus]